MALFALLGDGKPRHRGHITRVAWKTRSNPDASPRVKQRAEKYTLSPGMGYNKAADRDITVWKIARRGAVGASVCSRGCVYREVHYREALYCREDRVCTRSPFKEDRGTEEGEGRGGGTVVLR